MKHRLFCLFAISVIMASFVGNFIHPSTAAASGEDYVVYYKSQFLHQDWQLAFPESAIYARGGVFGSGNLVTFRPNSGASTGNPAADIDATTIINANPSSPGVGKGYYLGNYKCKNTTIYLLIGLDQEVQTNQFGSTQQNVGANIWVIGGRAPGSLPENGATISHSLPSCMPGNYNITPNNLTSPKATPLPLYYSMEQSKATNWYNFLKNKGQSVDSPQGGLGNGGAPTPPGAGGGAGAGGGGGADSAQLSCDAGFNPLNWLICAAIKGMVAVINGVDDILNSLLAIGTPDNSPSGDPSQIFDTSTDTGQAYYKAWSSFRDISLGLLVIAGLTMIIAQALGMEILDAYTIRKVLPRLIVMAILITLSWALLRFVVQLFNDLGYGVRFLIEKPFSSLSNTISISGGGGAAVGLATGAAIVSLGIFGLFTFVLTAVLAVFTAFLVLILRQVVVVALIILAPVALLMYILPNTQRFYKLWFDSFSGALLMFPLIVALIAAGRVFSAVANTDNPQGIGGFIAFAAYFAPYFMIPMTYRMAGGIMSGVGNFVNSRAQPFQQSLSKARSARFQQNMRDLAAGERYKSSNPLARGFNRASRGIATAPKAGVTPWKMRSRYQAALSQQEGAAAAEYGEKNEAFAQIKGNDDYMQATMASMGGGDSEADWRRYLSGQGYSGRSLEQGVAAIRLAKRGTNDAVFKEAAVRANASTGTGWKEGGAGAMMQSINEAAGGDRDKAARMLADARQRAGQARRVDLGGAGFGGQLMDMNAMEEGSMGVDEATRRNNRKVLQLNGAGAMAGARGDSMKLLAPEMMDELREAYASGNSTTIQRQLAKTANMYETISHASAENGEIFADNVLAQPVDGSMVKADRLNARGEVIPKLDASGNTIPVRNDKGEVVGIEHEQEEIPLTTRRLLDRSRNNDEFLNLRRELSNSERYAQSTQATDDPGLGGGGGLNPLG